VLQPDGKILLGGASVADGQRRFTIARSNADGTLDLTFGDPESRRSVPRVVDSALSALKWS